MLAKLTDIIREYKGDNSIEVNETTVIKEDLGMTSFDLIQLACAVEDEFDVEIPDKAIKDFKTISDVISFIEEQ
ncbi:MAG: acyl carrier protein [Clostridia bacterium]|nr:acyl carrier protein [Clostridia bacterium]